MYLLWFKLYWRMDLNFILRDVERETWNTLPQYSICVLHRVHLYWLPCNSFFLSDIFLFPQPHHSSTTGHWENHSPADKTENGVSRVSEIKTIFFFCPEFTSVYESHNFENVWHACWTCCLHVTRIAELYPQDPHHSARISQTWRPSYLIHMIAGTT
jgi:hypothetical protein